MSERRNRSCPEITFIEKEINQNKNKSFWLTEIIFKHFN